MQREHTALILLFVSTMGCERPDPASHSPERLERDVEVVVARVGGELIGASDVASRMRLGGLDRRSALEELIDEALLVNEARDRGLSGSAAERRAVERVMVRQMLKDFEAELTPESVPADAVRADFEEHRDKLQVPERRSSWHILVRDSSDAGMRLAESILRDVRVARDPRDVYERYESGEEATAIDVVVEDLPPISRASGFEKPFKDALFAAKAPGVLEGPVETSHGFHVIVLTSILPAETRELADVEDDIRERLSQQMRFQRVAGTVRELEEQGLVEYDDEGVDRLLSMSGLPTRAN